MALRACRSLSRSHCLRDSAPHAAAVEIAEEFVAISDPGCRGFRDSRQRCTTERLTPSAVAAPRSERWSTAVNCAGVMAYGWRPRRLPCAFARARPARTRSTIRPRSNSASSSSTWREQRGHLEGDDRTGGPAGVKDCRPADAASPPRPKRIQIKNEMGVDKRTRRGPGGHPRTIRPT